MNPRPEPFRNPRPGSEENLFRPQSHNQPGAYLAYRLTHLAGTPDEWDRTALAQRSGVRRSEIDAMFDGRRLPAWEDLEAVLLTLGVKPDRVPEWAACYPRGIWQSVPAEPAPPSFFRRPSVRFGALAGLIAAIVVMTSWGAIILGPGATSTATGGKPSPDALTMVPAPDDASADADPEATESAPEAPSPDIVKAGNDELGKPDGEPRDPATPERPDKGLPADPTAPNNKHPIQDRPENDTDGAAPPVGEGPFKGPNEPADETTDGENGHEWPDGDESDNAGDHDGEMQPPDTRFSSIDATVVNKIASGPSDFSESKQKNFLRSQADASCSKGTCRAPGSGLLSTGDVLIATCWMQADEVLNYDPDSPGIEDNPHLRESDIWVRARLAQPGTKGGFFPETFLEPGLDVQSRLIQCIV